VTIIAGSTGCGKTTQVPQYIYNHYNSLGKTPKIIITQPRRLAAVSIAKRLSKEIGSNLGEEVGFQIGMNSNFTDSTRILIATTGIFLQRIIHNEDLQNLTHIILDEVHERDIDIDFVLILLKHILSKNKNIKLILMSATIMVELFAYYFSETSIAEVENINYYEQPIKSENLENNPAPIIEINQGMYENKYVYIEEIAEKINPLIKIKFPSMTEFYSSGFYRDDFSFNFQNPYIDTKQYEICCYLIYAIDARIVYENESSTTILVFLPGVGEIQTMQETLNKTSGDRFEIFQLHSNMNEYLILM
jgi:ATP-dependent RNA helicase DHX57